MHLLLLLKSQASGGDLTGSGILYYFLPSPDFLPAFLSIMRLGVRTEQVALPSSIPGVIFTGVLTWARTSIDNQLLRLDHSQTLQL